MGRKAIDLTGYKKEKIEVIGQAGRNKSGNILWKYQCSCGKTGKATASNIKKMESCGCLNKVRGKEFFHNYNTTHGESRTRIYHIWGNMINRTSNKKDKSYKNYGDRGITVCEEWKDFLQFKEWALANGYQETLTLDRMDNEKGYYPSNCRWADRAVQDNNKRQSVKLEYAGKVKTIDQWAKEYNINRSTIVHRLDKGMTIKEAIETPVKGGNGTGYKPHIKKRRE